MDLMNQKVMHGEFGEGLVVDAKDGRLSVAFGDGVIRKLSLDFSLRSGVLRFVDAGLDEQLAASVRAADEKKEAERLAAAEEAEKRRKELENQREQAIRERRQKLHEQQRNWHNMYIKELDMHRVNGDTYVALHEAGHAVIQELAAPGTVLEVRIKKDNTGFMRHDISLRNFHNDKGRSEMLAALVSIGGHAAEKLYDVELSLGLGSDSDYGKLERDLRRFYSTNGILSKLYSKFENPQSHFSEQLKKDKPFLLEIAQDVLAENSSALLDLAVALQEKKKLTGDEARAIIAAHPAGLDSLRRYKEFISWYRRNPRFFEGKRDQYMQGRGDSDKEMAV